MTSIKQKSNKMTLGMLVFSESFSNLQPMATEFRDLG